MTYYNVDDYGWAYIPLSILLHAIFDETLTYWVHRWLHEFTFLYTHVIKMIELFGKIIKINLLISNFCKIIFLSFSASCNPSQIKRCYSFLRICIPPIRCLCLSYPYLCELLFFSSTHKRYARFLNYYHYMGYIYS